MDETNIEPSDYSKATRKTFELLNMHLKMMK